MQGRRFVLEGIEQSRHDPVQGQAETRVREDLETALRYRSHAEELRVIAADMLDPSARRMLLRIADDYDHMASSMEAIDRTYQTMRKA